MSTAKTFSPRPRDIERRWYVVDADGAVLGRLASEVAKILRGKHKPIFAPHADTGDHVIVVNARGVRVTGGKENEKRYYRHSGYPGGLRALGYTELLEKRPALAVEKAIKGMLPKNRLGRQMAAKLQVYTGPEHPHAAQQPKSLGLGEIPVWEGLPAPPSPPPQKKAPKVTRAPVARRAQRAEKTGPKGTSKPVRRPAEEAGPTPARPRRAHASTAKTTAAKTNTAKRSGSARRAASTSVTTDEAVPAAQSSSSEKKAPRRRRRSREGSEDS